VLRVEEQQMGKVDMTELQTFVAMLIRSRVAHGLRQDYNPPGTGVQVELNDREPCDVADFQFDNDGNLVGVVLCQD
jgi:hypothetical protein